MSDFFGGKKGSSRRVRAEDLEELNGDFEESEVEERAFGEVPDGTYEVVVDSVDLARSKSSDKPMLKWKLRILGPQYIDRFLWHNNMIAQPENMKFLKQDLTTCGLRLRKLSELPSELGALLDIKLEVVKRTRGEFTNIYMRKRLSDAGGGAGPVTDTSSGDIPF